MNARGSTATNAGDASLTARLDEAASAARDAQLPALYGIIESTLAERIGFKLMTVLQVDQGRLVRRHSSDLARYPAGGSKPIADDAWLARMLGLGLPVITDGAAQLRERFPDHEVILAMGCESVLNVPVRTSNRSLGTINLLHGRGHFTEGDAHLVLLFAQQLARAWLTSGTSD